jgi:hypothetical protein
LIAQAMPGCIADVSHLFDLMSHGGIPSDAERHDDCALRSRHVGEGLRGSESGRQVEAVAAGETEIVRQDMTIQFFSELGAEYTSTYAADKAA